MPFPMRRLTAGLLLALPLLACGLLGCGSGRRPAPFEERDHVRLTVLKELRHRPGHRTAEQVRQALGTPDYVDEEDGLYYGYCIEYSKSRDGPLGHDDEESIAPRVVVMQFDNGGILRRVRRRKVPERSTPGDEFAAVVRRWKQEAAQRQTPT